MKADPFPRLHPSSLVDWQGCGKRFELSELRGESPAFRHPAAINGTAIHRVIHHLHEDALWDAPMAAIGRLYDESFLHAVENPMRPAERDIPIWWGDGTDMETALQSYKADALEMIDGYRKDDRNREAKILASEALWRATFGGFDWEGTLDQAREIMPGIVEIVDLKSGSERISQTVLSMWPQGLTYALALENAVFRPIEAPEWEPWKPMRFKVERLTWLHLRDYLPYKRKTTREGVTYQIGDRRGPAFYRTLVTPRALSSHAMEIGMFSRAVQAGRFERRPSTYQCSRCKVQARCLAGYLEEPVDPASVNPEALEVLDE